MQNTIFSENKIINLTDGEYFFLTENFEFADRSEIQKAVSYIITNKKKNLRRTVRSVINNELDDKERNVIKLYYYAGNDTETISKICCLSRSSIYRILKNGLSVIENRLQYVLEYDKYFDDMSATELIKCVKEKKCS